jgi:F-type H+-transporting ATPase subunit delta
MTGMEKQSLQEKLVDAARQHTVLDVGGQRVAKVYAVALLNAAQAKGELADVLGELDDLVNKVFSVRPEFETFLTSGAVGRRQKEEVLGKTFQGRCSDTFLNFLLVLNHHERLDMLRGILQSAQELSDDRTGRMRVRVTSAVSLPDDQRNRLVAELRETFQREPLLDLRTDPDLLGGMVVRVGDWLYDASVRSQLLDIRHQIIERSSHEIQSGRDRFSSAN